MIDNPPPVESLNISIPIIIPIKGSGLHSRLSSLKGELSRVIYMVQGSGFRV